MVSVKWSRAWRDAVLLGATIFIISAVVGVVVYVCAGQGLKHEVQNNLMAVARSAANLTDIKTHETITRPEDKGNAAYEKVRAPYMALLHGNPDLAYIYTNVERDGKIVFIMDSEIPKPGVKEIPTGVLEDYPDATDTLKRAFATHQIQVEDQTYTDEWGTFLSAYAPLFDGDTFIGTVGVDIRVTDYLARLATLRLALGLGLGAAFIASVVAGAAAYRFRRVAMKDADSTASQARELERLERERLDAERAALAAEARRREDLSALAERFRHDMSDVLSQVTRTTQALTERATSVTAVTAQTRDHAARVADVSEQTAVRATDIAHSTHELAQSIAVISQQSQESRQVAAAAAVQADAASEALRALTEKADKVGEVITIISDIAAQINLLALNATIESARAGEAGRGFAVVATEVKNLSNRVAAASSDITRQITDVQGATEESARGVDEIKATIVQLLEMSQSVAAAAAQQQAATAGIERNAEESSHAVRLIQTDIHEVRVAANDTDSTVGFVVDAARRVEEGSRVMASRLSDFTAAVSAV